MVERQKCASGAWLPEESQAERLPGRPGAAYLASDSSTRCRPRLASSAPTPPPDVDDRTPVQDELLLALIDTQGALLRYFTLRLGPSEAPGAVQDVTEQALRQLHTYDPARGPPLPWIWTIARRVRNRRQRMVSRRYELQAILCVADTAGEPEDIGHLELSVAYGRLPAADKQVLALHYWYGMTYAEVAEMFGEACGTVKKRGERCVQRLRLTVADGPDAGAKCDQSSS